MTKCCTFGSTSNVQLIPHLAHNLQSVGQLMASVYSVVFQNNSCIVSDMLSGLTIAVLPMTQMFLLNVSSVVKKGLTC